jgi:hypothetical protein
MSEQGIISSSGYPSVVVILLPVADLLRRASERLNGPLKLCAVLTVAAVSSLVAAAERPVLILDCPVTSASPVFEMADFPAGAAIVRAERYRFTISPEGGSGSAATIRNDNAQADVVASESEFRITFENRLVVIDRVTGEFVLALQGARAPIGSGICTKREDRKF